MKNPHAISLVTFLFIFFFFVAAQVGMAQVGGSNTNPGNPPLNPNDSDFRIVACDGPAKLNYVIEGGKFTGELKDKNREAFIKEFHHEPPFVPCDFDGLMRQVQHLINIMMVVGVLGAIVGMTWAGALYITGDPGKIKKAHDIFPKIFIGFIIMLSAWFIIYQILSWLGNNDGFKTLLGNP